MFNKRSAAVFTSAIVLLCGAGSIEGFAAEGGSIVISQQKCDLEIIPDKFNTGAKGSLTKVSPNDTVCGIELKQGGDKVSAMIDLTDRNQGITGTVVIEDRDFSDFILRTRKDDETGRDIKIIFRNCKFSTVEKGRVDSRLTYEFENCTMNRFSGSNAKLTRCALGGSYQDAVLPFRNVTVEDCYFSDMVRYYPNEVHIDGTQIYGAEGIDVQNIKFDNCRFEIPYIRVPDNKATVNACIMLQLEYSSAHDLSFTDCVLNGGGAYSVYATVKSKKNKAPNWTIENAVFDNIKIGCSVLQKSSIYNPHADGVTMKNISSTDALYVSSVYKENGKTYFSVTNDTDKVRTLKIVTSGNTYSYNIPASPTGTELEKKKITSFAEMPVDKLISVPEDAEYAVCLDATNAKDIRQIRFVNYSGKQVKVDKTVFGGDEAINNDILDEGSCGKGVTYTYTKDHVLSISGSGKMDNYHSSFDPPWRGYVGEIKKVVMTEGVESVGNMAFRDCFGLEEVVLTEGLLSIGSRAFANCVTLTDITIPVSATDINENAFATLHHLRITYLNRDRTEVTVAPKFANDEARDMTDIKLKAVGKTFTADNTGKITIVGLAHGVYEAIVSKPRYAPVTVKINVGGSNSVPILYKRGDVNGDRIVDQADIALMQQKLCDWDVHYVYDLTADTNGDGLLNSDDLGLLQQYLCEWNVTIV